ncbi:MAG: hypothetical protein U0U09_12995 [Cyclobacteriaceae bacterium]
MTIEFTRDEVEVEIVLIVINGYPVSKEMIIQIDVVAYAVVKIKQLIIVFTVVKCSGASEL